MSAALYNADILRLATAIPHLGRLSDPAGTAERRSPICGSRVIVDVTLADDRRVADLGLEVRACALGQASSALMARHAIGCDFAELESARDALTAFLAGDRDDPGKWPGLEIFAAAVPHKARHASIRLAFEAAAEAVANARVSA
ncbi:MAG: iron-sulfur cluster assembly scaffold protein [Parasphingopyxis sp.]|uniref:iron-sulfur cluster assembly scaffold protein n=1 Tax=Parasphingopyxis sp. TaxID=1920299 RepID=UPI0032EBE54C